MVSKTCSKCKEQKPVDSFGKGRQCKPCISAYNAEYREKNLEQVKATQLVYREQHREHLREAATVYRNDNPSTVTESRRKWKEGNREVVSEYGAKWNRDNAGIKNAHTAKRRATLLDQTPTLSPLEKDLIDALYFIGNVLTKSCGEPFHIDHIHPLSKGGLHNFSNLRILSAEENLKKGDK